MENPNLSNLEFKDTLGRNTHHFGVTTETEVGGKLVGLKTFRNGKFKQVVALASALVGERRIFVKQFKRL